MGVKYTIKKAGGSTATIDEIHSIYINELEYLGRAPDTIRSYTSTWGLFKESNGFIGEEEVGLALTKDTIYIFIEDCMARGISKYTINHYIGDIKTFYRYCMSKKMIPTFDIQKMKVQETQPKFYSDEELSILLEPPYDMNDYVEVRTWMINNFIAATGARASTICNMRVEDIDFHSNLITYRHTKNRKFQTIPLTPALAPLLKKYIDEWRRGGGWLFTTIDERQMVPNTIRLAFNRFCDERGVSSRGVHQIRHSFANHAVKAGIDPYRLQIALGHSDIKMSAHYVHIWSGDILDNLSQYTILDSMKQDKKRTKKIKRETD